MRFALVVAVLMVVACGGAPKAGDSCDPSKQDSKTPVCPIENGTTGLFCEGLVLTQYECPAGCSKDFSTDSEFCNFSGATSGRCPGYLRGTIYRCADATHAQRCGTDGLWTVDTCSGDGGCTVDLATIRNVCN